ncbi:MAG: alpha-1,6-glucosidase domain-containing protein [Pseudomonadota bacterium]
MRTHLQVSIAAVLAALAGAASAGVGTPDIAACDAPFQTVLQAGAGATAAAAVWLDERNMQWPGAAGSGVFKLAYSANGTLAAGTGARLAGADRVLTLEMPDAAAASKAATGFGYLKAGPVLRVRDADAQQLAAMHTGQLLLVLESNDGTVLAATRVQHGAALDALYRAAEAIPDLGVRVGADAARFTLWAPTARNVALCTYDSGSARANAIAPMLRDAASGAWRASGPGALRGKYYAYVVDVFVPGAGMVRNLVTDPYSVSVSTDSKRSYIADLAQAALKPKGWDRHRAPRTVKAQTDMSIYELHVRDFSVNDATVSAPNRGKYAAFSERGSNGMRHLAALARAGMTDVHLLPVYDIGSVPESGCIAPAPSGAPDGEEQQALVSKSAETDCFNWGYDPFHYNAPEGSYASDAADGARRVVELRAMVMNLHQIGLRVGMDVVYNHTFASGQKEKSVLDRIVPGYYHRLDGAGAVEQSTCCDNTATERRMMGKLMIESAELWAREYKIDSFRFDLMGHQPRAVMEQLRRRVDAAAGKPVQLIGEGWNFGEVANGARFVQASQLSLNGSGIGTFSDRARDAVRGGSAGDSGADMVKRQGYINGLVYDPNAQAGTRPAAELLKAADMVRVGLAGSIRSYTLQTHEGAERALEAIDYGGQPAGYASEPGEVVNYVENHDNQTLYDMNVFKLPAATSGAERARVQVLGAAINAFSQGVAYYHAGIDTLRSKSLERNSFNSGDWFNRIDWSYQDNYFGTGLPRFEDNGKDWALIKPLLANRAFKPAPADIAFARDAFRDLLRIRASSTLLRLRNAADIKARLRFVNTGAQQEPTVLAALLDGAGYPGARFRRLAYFVNVDKVAHTVAVPQLKGEPLKLHPVHRAAGAADARAASASYKKETGSFIIPARTAVTFVQ